MDETTSPGPDDDRHAGRRVLRPGVRALRRDDGRLQVGCDPGRRVLLPDVGPARQLVAALVSGRRRVPDSPAARRWAEQLDQHGLLVDTRALADARHAEVDRDVVLAAVARHGGGAVPRLHARTRARVLVDTDDTRTRDDVRGRLTRAGLRVGVRPHGAVARLVVTTDGEPDRRVADPWLRTGLPHLFVTHRSGRLTVGPLVVAGLTACLRCLDAYDGEADPGHAQVLARHAPHDEDRPDPALLDVALGVAVRDLVAFVEGDLPATWSTVVEVDPGLALPRRELGRHPRCGCSWGDGVARA